MRENFARARIVGAEIYRAFGTGMIGYSSGFIGLNIKKHQVGSIIVRLGLFLSLCSFLIYYSFPSYQYVIIRLYIYSVK